MEPGEIEIPEIIPVMTLQDTVLFPHAIMPLYIFEQRYRTMLRDVLGTHRLFAIFNESGAEAEADFEEPPVTMGTVGVIRAAHENPDGTSNLALQGVVRVRLLEIVQEAPYRTIRVEACTGTGMAQGETDNQGLRKKILKLLSDEPELTCGLPEEYVQFLYSLEQPDSFIDVAIHSLCQNPSVKQQLLETLCLSRRYEHFTQFLLREQHMLHLYQKLQGQTRDDEIQLN